MNAPTVLFKNEVLNNVDKEPVLRKMKSQNIKIVASMENKMVLFQENN